MHTCYQPGAQEGLTRKGCSSLAHRKAAQAMPCTQVATCMAWQILCACESDAQRAMLRGMACPLPLLHVNRTARKLSRGGHALLLNIAVYEQHWCCRGRTWTAWKLLPGKTVNMTMELKVGKWQTEGCTAGVCGMPACADMARQLSMVAWVRVHGCARREAQRRGGNTTKAWLHVCVCLGALRLFMIAKALGQTVHVHFGQPLGTGHPCMSECSTLRNN